MNSYTRATITAVFAYALWGCGAPAPDADPSGDTTAAALSQPNGGLTTTDEAPDFGDPAVAALPELSTAVGVDALLDEGGSYAGDAVAAPQRHVYRVMVLWGHLPRPQDGAAAALPAAPAAPIDWTGSLAVDGGRLSVRRTLAFDRGDSVAARTDPARVDFVSRTEPFVDGMALTVRADGPSPVLHFRTAAATLDLALPDADGAVHYLADGRNGVFYSAYEESATCRQGFVFGHWSRIRSQLGLFRGRVLDAGGAPAGAIRGLWGANRAGERVFFGKHISNRGVFDGLLGGAYDAGHFAGVWGLRDGQRGEMHGRYFDGVERADGRGPFLGRWRESCAAR